MKLPVLLRYALALIASTVTIAAGNTIPEVAAEAGFDTLVAAAEAAGLIQFLSQDGPYTVFAPTDEAFDALPAGALKYLLENTDVLGDVLKYHVVSGKIGSADIPSKLVQKTILEEDVTIRKYAASGWICYLFGYSCETTIVVNDAIVVSADVPADNGIIHVIDKVLIPENVIIPLDIVQTAIQANFFTLVAAVTAADLVPTLQGEDPPLTVFAPSEAAWRKLPPGLLFKLLSPENKEILKDILLYHVLSSKVPSSVISDGLTQATTINNNQDTIEFSVVGDKVMVNQATVTSPDIIATNGIIHVIDEVLLPPGAPDLKSIIDTAAKDESLATLITAIEIAGLVHTLNLPGPFTVFAPSDNAFQSLETGVLDNLIENPHELANILKFHVVWGEVSGEEAFARDGQSVRTLSGSKLDITVVNDGDDKVLKINDATVVRPDVLASNGVIHIIDKVLIPSEQEDECTYWSWFCDLVSYFG